ncbi:PREDICTED: protein disulfide isomerase-like 1-6 [Nicotiana attenuata]|uniref:protein disulfide-isomerase n=1 Tax=Nicotiana attenuata TaxID=49451 RepID=A0A1J6IXH9_NICAT|nr:PREDICTED: protein disulfide isomerase-like 1-6 [Nicotiana attenuata]OIT05272.1 protein disulfide isomerase-like 1-6 [Nicotiana attenuata]
MYNPKPTSRFILFSLVLLLLLSFLSPSISSELDLSDEDGDDVEALEELIALDEQEDSQQQNAESEFVSKAQRIVLELNNDNTKRAIDGNEYVLVLGYAPWCVRSAELMPKFAEAATALKELGSPLLMAKIDAERYPKIASTLDIKGFPTLLLFVNGTSQPYTGGFSAEELVIWARKKTGVPVIRISSDAEASQFLNKYSMFVVGLFDKSEGPDYNEFTKAAKMDNEIQFVETSNAEIAKHLFPNFKPTNLFLGLVKSEPEKYSEYEGTFSTEGILQFLDDNKFPLITVLTELNAARVYSSSNKLQVLIIAEPDDFKKNVEPLQDVARKFKSQIMFIFVDIREDNLAKPFLTMFGLEESKDSVVISFNYRSNLKYLLESDATPTSIEDFCSGLLSGSVSPYYKSQPIPDNKNMSILTVVGKTFDELIMNSPENILLEIYTPWCITCETTSKQMEKLAKHFKGLANLIFARIDASLNEHPNLQVDDYPTLLFYSADDKTKPIQFPTKSSAKDLAALINKNLKAHDPEIRDEL